MSTEQTTEHIKLTDTNRLVRDPHSKGLVSVDKAGLGAYRAMRKSSEQIVTLEQDINSIYDELKRMKELLHSCVRTPQPA